MTHSPPPLDDHGVRHAQRADGEAARLTVPRDDADLDACDGYVVLVIDRQLGEVDSYGPYHRGVAEGERRRRQDVVDADALDDVDVRLARFHWPAAHLDVRSTVLHDRDGASGPGARPRGT